MIITCTCGILVNSHAALSGGNTTIVRTRSCKANIAILVSTLAKRVHKTTIVRARTENSTISILVMMLVRQESRTTRMKASMNRATSSILVRLLAKRGVTTRMVSAMIDKATVAIVMMISEMLTDMTIRRNSKLLEKVLDLLKSESWSIRGGTSNVVAAIDRIMRGSRNEFGNLSVELHVQR